MTRPSAEQAKWFEKRHYNLTVERAKTRGYRRDLPVPAFAAFEEKISEAIPNFTQDHVAVFATCSGMLVTEKSFLYPFDAEDYGAFGVRPTPPVDPSWIAFQPKLDGPGNLSPMSAVSKWQTCLKPVYEVTDAPVTLPNEKMRQA